MKISDLKGSTGTEAVLLYGGPKVGKTTFASTFPTPIFIADFDGGVSAIVGHPKADEIEFQTLTDPDPESAAPVYEWEDLVSGWWKEYRQTGRFPYRTVVVDSATVLLKLLMNKAFQQSVASRDSELKRVLGVAPARGHWNVQMSFFDQEVRRLLALPCYKVLICHEDQPDPAGRIRPLLTGKQKEGVFPLFSEIYHLETIGEGTRVFVVRLRPNEYVFAGSRLDREGRIGELFRWTENGHQVWDAFQRMLKIWGVDNL